MPADIKTSPVSGGRLASLEGSVFTCQSEADRIEAIDKAFDYRGDVTLQVRGETIEGFIFNRDASAKPPRIEMFIKGSDEPRIIPYADVESIAFTGKDTANGKSWDAWVSKKAAERQAEAERLAAEAAERGHL
jgi:hypothetical protein